MLELNSHWTERNYKEILNWSLGTKHIIKHSWWKSGSLKRNISKVVDFVHSHLVLLVVSSSRIGISNCSVISSMSFLSLGFHFYMMLILFIYLFIYFIYFWNSSEVNFISLSKMICELCEIYILIQICFLFFFCLNNYRLSVRNLLRENLLNIISAINVC